MIEYEVIDNIPQVELDLLSGWNDIGQYMVGSIQETMDTGGRGDWPPPKRERLFGSGSTQLKKSGALYNSGTYRADERGVTITFGAGLPYAWIQNFGGTTHPKVTQKMKSYFWFLYFASEGEDEFWKWMALKPVGEVLNIDIPARAFMVVQEEDKEYIKDKIGSSIVFVYPDGHVDRGGPQ